MGLDQTIKQRLLGAVVLIALAIIFLPGILGKKNVNKQFQSKIPAQPQLTRQAEQTISEQTTSEQTTSEQTTSEQTITDGDESESRLTDAAVESNSERVPQTETQPQSQPNSPIDNQAQSTAQSAAQANSASTKTHPGQDLKNAATEPDKTAQATQAVVKEQQHGFPLKSSWIIQVGSFSSRTNAQVLSDKLEQAGLKAFVRHVNIKDKKMLYRVYVGPWLKKKQAQAKLEQAARKPLLH